MSTAYRVTVGFLIGFVIVATSALVISTHHLSGVSPQTTQASTEPTTGPTTRSYGRHYSLGGPSWTNLYVPTGAIEYQGGIFRRDGANGVLKDVVIGHPETFFNVLVRDLPIIVGYAHNGQLGYTATQANQLITAIQIWGWLDRNGNGVADEVDARNGSKWILLNENRPADNSGDGSHGSAVGWQVGTGNPMGTSAWADILQKDRSQAGAGIHFHPKESWLLLIRVTNTAGITNLCTTTLDGNGHIQTYQEHWDDGNITNGIGSDIAGDQYITNKGNTPGTSDHRIPDMSIVSVYIPKD